jgi:hypothetical protein
MTRAKYPLQPLLDHRERKVDAATAELGDAVRDRERAEAARARAEAASRESEARAASVRAAEAAALVRGELRVEDLARAGEWEIGARAQSDELRRAVVSADAKVDAATSAEGEARGELARLKADHDVVAKDQARFDAQVRKRHDAADEEAAEEAHLVRSR